MSGQTGPSVDHGREPCPDRILDDIGGAFGMGAVGGGLWHLLKGVKNSPRGSRMLGGIEVSLEFAATICAGLAVPHARSPLTGRGCHAEHPARSAKDRRQLRGMGWLVLHL